MLIDIHTHVIPIEGEQRIRSTLQSCLGTKFDESRILHSKNISFTEYDMIEQLTHGEIDKAVVLATDHKGMHISDFVYELAERYPDLIIPSVAVDPRREDAVAKLKQGLIRLAKRDSNYKPVVKFTPHRWISPADVNINYFKVIADYGGMIVAHTGPQHTFKAESTNKYTDPRHWINILNEFPSVAVIGSHCGTPSQEFESYENHAVDMAIKHHNFYIDFSGLQSILPSGNYFSLTKPTFERVVRSIEAGSGIEHKIVGGSDYFIVPDINVVRHQQIGFLNGLIDPYTNSEKVLLKE